MVDKKIFLITGTGRNGSTLLDMMLGNGPHGFSGGEMHALFRPWRPHHLLGSDTCFCNDQNCDFWKSIKQEGERKVYKNIFDRLDEKEYIVDSSKNPLWISDQLKYNKDNDYDLIPIIIFKTPLEYAYSRFKRDRLDDWKRLWIENHLRIFEVLDDFVTVKYQELAKNPEKKLRSLCNQVGVNYFEGKEKFWNNNTKHFLFGSETTKRSEELIYYDEQYNEQKLNQLKDKIDMDNEMINQILDVLEGYEVDSNDEKNYEKLKRRIGEYKFFDRVGMRMRNTKYYWFNHTMEKLNRFMVKILR